MLPSFFSWDTDRCCLLAVLVSLLFALTLMALLPNPEADLTASGLASTLTDFFLKPPGQLVFGLTSADDILG